MNSKGIEIAVSQIVILIIGIVILSLGIAFLYNVFYAAQEQLPSLDARLESQIEDALRSGDIVELPANTKTIGFSDLAVFNLGIRNDPKLTTASNDFTIVISAKEDSNQEWITKGLLAPEFTIFGNKASTSFELGDEQNKIFTFGISPKAISSANKARGQYFFNVCVFNSASAPINTCDATSYANNPSGNYDFKTFSVVLK